MAEIGQLWYSVFLKDMSDKDIDKIKKKFENLNTKLALGLDAKAFDASIKAALKQSAYDVKVNVVVDKANATEALRQAMQRAGTWNGNFTASDLRATRAQEIQRRTQAYIDSQRALERSRDAMAALREQRLADMRASTAQRKAQRALNTALEQQDGIVKTLRNELLNIYSVYTIQNFLRQVVEIGGEFEKQHIALSAILHDAGQATTIFEKIKSLAVESPFGVIELSSYVKQLAAYNIPYNELYETTKRLADISAGVGVDMGRIILAYGQVRSAKFLKGTELRQFTEAGIPLVQELADKFSELEGRAISAGEVIDMISKRKVSFEDVRDVLWNMTDEGGMFHNMQENLSESISGMWSNLRDAYDIMLAEIAESTNTLLKAVISGLTELMRHWKDLATVIISAVGVYGAQRVAMGYNNVLMGKENALLYRNALASKQREVNNLRVAASYRTLTAAEQGKIASAGRLSTAEWQAMATSGALTKEYALRLVALKKLNVGQAGHLAQILGITRAELAAAAASSRWSVAAARVGVAMRGIVSAMKSFLPVAAISLVLEAYMSWWQKNEDMKQSIEELSEKAQEGYKNIHSVLTRLGGVNLDTVSGDSLMPVISELQETLKNYSPRYNDIQKEADGIQELSERYKYLATSLKETEEAYKTLETIKSVSESANEATDGFFDESFRENIADYIDVVSEADKRLRELSKYRVSIESAISEAMNIDPSYAKAASGKSYNEQIRLLLDYGDAYRYVINSFSGKVERPALLNYFDEIREYNSIWNEDVMPDLKDYAESLKQGLEAENWDFSNLTQAQEDALRMAFNDFLNGIPGMTEELRQRLQNEVLTVNFNIKPVLMDYDSQPILSSFANLLKDVSNEGLFTQKELEGVSDASSAYKLWSKSMQEAKEQLEALQNINTRYMNEEDADVLNSKIQSAQQRVKDLQAAGEAAFKSTGGTTAKTSTKDLIAEQWQNRISLIEKALSAYKEWAELEGEESARKRVVENPVYKEVVSYLGIDGGLENPEKIWAEVQKKLGNTKEQNKLRVNLGFKIDDLQRGDLKEQLARSMKEMEAYISETTEKWDIYKKLFESTGDKELSSGIAFGQSPEELSDYAEEIKKAFDTAMGKAGTPYTFDSILAGGIEGLPDSVKSAFDKTKKELDSFEKEERKLLESIVEEYRTASDEIAAIEADRARKINAIDKALAENRISQARAGQLTSAVNSKADYDVFSQSADYLKFFSAIYSLTQRQAVEIGNKIRENLDERLRAGVLTADEYSKELERIDEQLSKIANRKDNLASFFTGGLDGLLDNIYNMGSSKRQEGIINLKDALGESVKAMQTGNTAAQGIAQSNMASANAMIQGGEGAMQGAQGAMSAVAVVDMIVNGINNTVQGIKEAVDLIMEMYESLGKDTGPNTGIGKFSAFMSTFAEASQHAADGWNSLKQGDIGGVISGVVGSWTSIFTGIAKFHDAKLQEIIEDSQLEMQRLDNIRSQIERTMEYTLGDSHNIKLVDAENDIRQVEKLKSEINSIKSKPIVSFTNLQKLSEYSEELEKLQEHTQAYEEGGAYGYERQLMKEQLEELEKQRAAELGKKDVDQSAVADYDAQIAEMEDNIRQLAEETADALYGINMKDWASQLGDALYEAWQKGEDGAEAFKETAASIMGDVMNSILKLSVLEPAMEQIQEALFGTDGESGMFGSDFELDNNEVSQIADMLMGISEKSDDYYDALDKLNDYMEQKYGVSMKEEEETSSGGLSAGIQSVTEDTADLLASYVNAIRADVSIERTIMENLLGKDMPSLSATAQAQLTQLQAIADNTLRNAVAAEAIQDILRKNTNGANSFNIK